MKRHMEELERRKEMGRVIEERHKRSLEGRMAAAASASTNASSTSGIASKSGIGTKSRQKIERTKRKEGHVVIDTSKQRELRCAVYITGLPVEVGEEKEGSISEDGLSALFGSYGTIKRVTLYVDRRTGRRKGDGLVVYDIPKLAGSGSSGWKAAEDIVRSVCEQVSKMRMDFASNIAAFLCIVFLLSKLLQVFRECFGICLYVCDFCGVVLCPIVSYYLTKVLVMAAPTRRTVS